MKHDVQRIKETYIQGMRVRLLKMNDIQAPPIGCEGTVQGVDDVDNVMVAWDTGSSLSVVLDRAIRCGNDTSESVYDSRGLLVF